MANIKSFPNNQDVYIGAEDVMKWLHGRTSGVFAGDSNAAVYALVDSSMAVAVSDGLGWMANAGKDGVVWWIDNEAVNGTKLQLPIDPADGVLNRIDRIIVEWKTTNYVDYPEVKVLKGSLSSNPTAPALTNNSTVRQISLAMVNVAAGTTAITASMITDERLDPSVCGLVTENVVIDTSVMQKQFEELLNAIRMELQDLNNGTEALLKVGGTMYGCLDMGGNNIKNVAPPIDDTDVPNKEYVDGKLSMELLWENASPTSSFLAQNVSLDLNSFDMVLVTTKYNTGAYYVDMTLVKIGSQAIIRQFASANAKSTTYASRNVTVSKNSVNFTSGYAKSIAGTTAGTENNGVAIPVRIYGIKGVSA
jgi:hypothetical protein